MVYKKYIRRNGKVFGPYYYESYREDGKVKTRFISGPRKKWVFKKIKSLISRLPLFLLLIMLSMLIVASLESIILISKAEHFNENREFVSDIYNKVKKQDNIWSEVIPNNHFVRVIFEKNLTKNNDITIYAKGINNSINNISVYRKNSNQEIAAFLNISNKNRYIIYLTNLSSKESLNTFDFKVQGQGVEFDYIVDPLQQDTNLSNSNASFIGEAGDSSGVSVSSVGDVNGDGYDDILIGAYLNDEGGDNAGQVYLIFGKSSGWSMDTNLSNANASFYGEKNNDNAGFSVSSAGDVNNDGYDDILIGADGNDQGGSGSGQSYIIFGKSSGWSMDVNLSNADASFYGENGSDNAGFSVSSAGDVNGDAFDDILIGARGNDEGGTDVGHAYIIFGKSSGWNTTLNLSNANASFYGENGSDQAGESVSSAG